MMGCRRCSQRPNRGQILLLVNPGLRRRYESRDNGRRTHAYRVPTPDPFGNDERGGARCLWVGFEHVGTPFGLLYDDTAHKPGLGHISRHSPTDSAQGET